jgi:hypothetical protein
VPSALAMVAVAAARVVVGDGEEDVRRFQAFLDH